MTRKIVIIAILFTLQNVLLHAQNKDIDTISLESLWQKSEDNNTQLKLQKLGLDRINNRTEILKEDKLPEINLNGQYSRVSNLPIFENGLFNSPAYFPVVHNSYSAKLDAGFNLYNGGNLKRKIEKNEIDEEIGNDKVNLSRQDIHYQITIYFLEMYRNSEYKKFISQDIIERENQLKDIQNLYNKGVVLKSDLLRAQLNLSQQKEYLSEIENNITIANQAINQLTGENLNHKIYPIVDFETLENAENQLDSNIQNTFEYQILQEEHHKSELNLKDAKSNILPRFNLFAEYGLSYPQILFYPYAISWYGLGMAGVKASLPISNLYTNKRKVEDAKIEIAENQLKTQEFEEKFELENSRLNIKYEEALEKMDVAKENIQSASETYRIMHNTYFAQLSLLTDLLDAETKLIQSKIDYTTQEVNAILIQYQIQKLKGKL